MDPIKLQDQLESLELSEEDEKRIRKKRFRELMFYPVSSGAVVGIFAFLGWYHGKEVPKEHDYEGIYPYGSLTGGDGSFIDALCPCFLTLFGFSSVVAYMNLKGEKEKPRRHNVIMTLVFVLATLFLAVLVYNHNYDLARPTEYYSSEGIIYNVSHKRTGGKL